MANERGGKRRGAGRPRGSKNKMTIAQETVAKALDVKETAWLTSDIHRRGHTMLIELERLALDPREPIAARIMAIKVALPFMLPKQHQIKSTDAVPDDLVRRIHAGRERAAMQRGT